MDDDVIVVNQILEELDEALEDVNNVPRQFYTRHDPFETLSDARFIKLFRLPKNLVQELIQTLTPYIQLPQRQSALAPSTKVLVALLFYAHGSYQSITGLNVFTGVSQSSVSRCVNEITGALNNPAVVRQWIKFPGNANELTNMRTRFYTKFQFPGCVGCIDCTHVAIVPPSEEEHIYVNRKGYHSLNVQLVCDENLTIMHVNSRFPGSCHDSHIWRQSNLSAVMETIYRNEPNNPFFLVGDSGYALRPWLLTPLREEPLPNTPEERFNTCLKRVRNSIERCNGTLKNRFRCLLKHRVLHYKPVTAAKIVIACVVLHNMCIANNIPEPELDAEMLHADFGMYNDAPVVEHHVAGRVNQDLAAGQELQRQIIQNHFV